MTISYQMRAADHWGLNRYVMTHDLSSGGSMLIAVLLVPGFFFASMLRDGKPMHEAAIQAFTVVAIAILAGYPMFRILAWTKFRKMPAQMQRIEMTLEGTGIRVVTPSVNQMVKWSAIARIRRDRQAIYLFLSRRAALIVPLRAFSTQADVVSFLDYARQHTGDR